MLVPFAVTRGVLQGDTLAPFLFFIVLDYVLTRATTGEHGILASNGTDACRLLVLNTCIPDLDFADDIVLLDSNLHGALSHIELD